MQKKILLFNWETDFSYNYGPILTRLMGSLVKVTEWSWLQLPMMKSISQMSAIFLMYIFIYLNLYNFNYSFICIGKLKCGRLECVYSKYLDYQYKLSWNL